MIRTTVGAALALAGLCVSSVAFAAAPAPLFEALDPSGASFTLTPDDDPTILRQRPVRVDERALGPGDPASFALEPGPTVLLLNFFDDAPFYVRIDAVEETPSGKGTIRRGVIEGRPESEVTLVTEEGVTIGNLRDGEGRTFQILLDPSGTPVVRQIDESRFPPEIPPIPIFNPAEEPPLPAPSWDDTVDPLLTRDTPDLSGALVDDGSIVDVLVLYTPSARAAVGGPVAMKNKINLAVTETNTGYANSGVVQRVRLVHSQEVSYNEAGSNGMSDALGRLANAADGYMDIAHTLRTSYAADMVVLLINNNQNCGYGYLMATESNAFKTYAFSVTHHSCATGNYTFAHEMGHNQGCTHDRANASSASAPVAAYAYGYQHPTAPKFYTIMAYYCAGCVRINYWSNPAVSYSGVPTGRAANVANPANNALSMNNTRDTVSNWRLSKYRALPVKATPVSPKVVAYSNKPAYRWNAIANASKYQLAVWWGGTLRYAAWLPATDVGCGAGTGVCSYTPNLTLPSAATLWKIRAGNPVGDGPWGDQISFTPTKPGSTTTVWPTTGVTLTTKRPTFQWSRNVAAHRYLLQVKDSVGWRINIWYTQTQAGCATAGTTCRIVAPVALTTGSVQWWIKADNPVGVGPVTGPIAFTVP
ncbi:MAG: hypothetical protein HQK87_04555 [Nitrospinae bacterium]|nr:hypothetical protein [Nitrospinota bacterium]